MAGSPGPPGSGAPATGDPHPAGHGLPALLLLSGVALLGIGIGVARRFRTEETEGGEAEEAVIGEPGSAPTQLTLVRIPSEHGP